MSVSENKGEYPVKAYGYWRVSSNEQKEGFGFARQRGLVDSWLARKGIALDESLSFKDIASSFRSKNQKKGLGLFMQACKEKRVARGSYLLCESLDRLSRDNLFAGQKLIRELLYDYGIVVVTLTPEMEFSADNYETTHWLMDAEFQRAHSESRMKSYRSTDNWERLRKQKVISSKRPNWLDWDGESFKKNEGKCEIVKRIFTLSSKGFGAHTIAKKLNADKVPVMGTGKKAGVAWHESTIGKLLNNRAVLGEYQPRKRDGETFVAVGEVRKNYFPAAITETLWASSRAALTPRREQKGRISDKVSNLFTGITWEGDMPSSYKATGGIGYLVRADRASPGIRYDHFERVFLWWIQEVKLTLKADGDYDSVKSEADALEKQINGLKKKIAADPSLLDMLDTVSAWNKKLAALKEKLDTLAIPIQSHFLHGQRLIAAMKDATGSELETMRREVRLAIRSVVRKIKIEREDMKGQKVYRVWVEMIDGQVYLLHYVVSDNRITSANRIIFKDGGNLYEYFGFPIEVAPVEKLSNNVEALFSSGKTREEIATELKMNVRTVSRHLAAARAKKGSPTASDARAQAKAELRAKVLAMKGESAKDVAEACGVHVMTVNKIRREG